MLLALAHIHSTSQKSNTLSQPGISFQMLNPTLFYHCWMSGTQRHIESSGRRINKVTSSVIPHNSDLSTIILKLSKRHHLEQQRTETSIHFCPALLCSLWAWERLVRFEVRQGSELQKLTAPLGPLSWFQSTSPHTSIPRQKSYKSKARLASGKRCSLGFPHPFLTEGFLVALGCQQ